MSSVTVPAPRQRASDEAATLLDEARAAAVVWQRELIRFARTRTRILTSLVQPLLFLFVLGNGLSRLIGSTGGFDFKQFVFPGVVAMSVLTTAIFGAVSIVWDREFGFLREMLVSPANRLSLLLGKTAGGATVATAQGTIMLVLAPAVGVHLTPLLVVQVIGAELLMATALTAFGVVVASRMRRMESFQVVMQLLLLPMLFLSGAMFPLQGLPSWLGAITRLDPLTYAVDPLRRLVFAAQHLPAAAAQRFGTGVELFGRTLPVGLEFGIVTAFALVCLGIAMQGFGKPE